MSPVCIFALGENTEERVSRQITSFLQHSIYKNLLCQMVLLTQTDKSLTVNEGTTASGDAVGVAWSGGLVFSRAFSKSAPLPSFFGASSSMSEKCFLKMIIL